MYLKIRGLFDCSYNLRYHKIAPQLGINEYFSMHFHFTRFILHLTPHRILHDDRGSTVGEFALIAPVLTLIIFGIIESSLIMYTSAIMEGATITSSRTGKTGFQPAGTTREQLIRDTINQRAGSILNINNITITSQTYGSFGAIGDPEPFTDLNGNGQYNAGEQYSDVNGNGQWDSDQGALGLGSAGSIVLYRVSYPWPISTPIMRQFFGSSGTYTITSSMVVKNEPYNFIQVGR